MKPTRVFDFIDQQKRLHNGIDVCIAGKEKGIWKTYSTDDVIQIINKVSISLLNFGINKGDKIAIVSENRPEWSFIDLACSQIGAVVVPIYPTITIEDYNYIFNHSVIKIAFIESHSLVKKIKSIEENIPSLQEIYSFEELDHVYSWKKFLLEIKEDEIDRLIQVKKNIQENDLYTIVYTSGTTGPPKGVMLSHKNVTTNAIAAAKTLPVSEAEGKALSFLPLSHVYERTSVFSYLSHSISVYYAENVLKVAENLREVQPDVFCTVPRLLEKVYDTIVAKGMETGGIKKAIFFWALNLGLKFDPEKKQGIWQEIQHQIADKLVFSKWREALGGNIKNMNVGAAALQPRLIRSFWAAGIKVCEGYGMSEASPIVCVNRITPNGIMVGTVGPTLDGIEVKIAADGEILVKGPNVMQGYYKQPELSAETIVDGWLHTGDIGELVDGKFLKITDRKKELFKTSTGKYIAPQLLENKLKESFFIEQVAVIGSNQKFASALIVPNFDALEKWSKEQHIAFNSKQELVKNSDVFNKFKKEIQKVNIDFARWEKIQKFKLLENEWTVETGEVTPTLKPKRKIINQKYEKEIGEIYS